jgi:hypothetical protein
LVLKTFHGTHSAVIASIVERFLVYNHQHVDSQQPFGRTEEAEARGQSIEEVEERKAED